MYKNDVCIILLNAPKKTTSEYHVLGLKKNSFFLSHFQFIWYSVYGIMFSTHYLTDINLCETDKKKYIHWLCISSSTNISNKLDGLRYKLCHYKVCVHIWFHWVYNMLILYSIVVVIVRFCLLQFLNFISIGLQKCFHFSSLIQWFCVEWNKIHELSEMWKNAIKCFRCALFSWNFFICSMWTCNSWKYAFNVKL